MRSVWLIAVATGLGVHACGAFAAEATERIAAYIGATERIRHDGERAVSGLGQSNPQVAAALSRSLSFIEPSEVNARTAAVLDKYMTAPDIRSISTFMNTAPGRRFGRMLRATGTSLPPGDAAASYPPGVADNPAFSSPAMARMLAAMDSPEWHQTWKAYGEVLMCRALQNDDPPAYERVQKLGRCTVAEQGGPNPAVRRSDPNR